MVPKKIGSGKGSRKLQERRKLKNILHHREVVGDFQLRSVFNVRCAERVREKKK